MAALTLDGTKPSGGAQGPDARPAVAEPTTPAERYDAVPYPSLSHPLTHPSRIAAIARLLGLATASPASCRVLEIGCAGGGNLLPMASGLPGSAFLGIDVSGVQIDEARRLAAAAGIPNVRFEQLDLRDLPPDVGPFDLIVAHGLLSWVDDDVRAGLFELCRRHLAPAGVAYISYNTYPGWHLLAIVREIMLFRTRDIADPTQRARAARDAVRFVAENAAESATPGYVSLLSAYLEHSPSGSVGLEAHDRWLLHDELEVDNRPFSFHEFMTLAERHGLQYLAEADFPEAMPPDLSPHARGWLGSVVASQVELEQYTDFLRGRQFRRTLLCRAEMSVDRGLRPERLVGLAVTTRATEAEPDIGADGKARFVTSDGFALTTADPGTTEAFRRLIAAAPSAVEFGALADAVLGAVDRGGLARRRLGADVLKGFTRSAGLATLLADPPALTVRPGERPVADAVARIQARERNIVTNRAHERVTLDQGQRLLITKLDGSHDRRTLAATAVADGLDGPSDAVALVERDLARLGRAGLLC